MRTWLNDFLEQKCKYNPKSGPILATKYKSLIKMVRAILIEFFCANLLEHKSK